MDKPNSNNSEEFRYVCAALIDEEPIWRWHGRAIRKQKWVAKARKAMCMAKKLPRALRQNQRLRRDLRNSKRWISFLEKRHQSLEDKEDKWLQLIKTQERQLANWKRKAAKIAEYIPPRNGESLVEAVRRVVKETPRLSPRIPQQAKSSQRLELQDSQQFSILRRVTYEETAPPYVSH